MMRTFRRHTIPVLFATLAACAAVEFIAIPALAQFAQPGTTMQVGTSAVGSVVDLAPMLMVIVEILATLALVAAAWFIFRHVTNQDARNALLSVAEKAVAFGINATNGALKDKTMSVNLGSSVVATAMKYALNAAPDALKKFGWDDKTLARALWARLPGVDGGLDDATLNQIVAAGSGTAPAGSLVNAAAVSAPALAEALLAAIQKAKENGSVTNAAPAPAPVVPQASSAAPQPS